MGGAEEAKKHHYIPVFYLKRWAEADGRLCQFSQPRPPRVIPSRRHPGATGYLLRGYELRGFPAELAQQVETTFFRRIDTLASDSLSFLEQFPKDSEWTLDLRSAWTRFMLSLMLRCPEDIRAFRSYWSIKFGQTSEDQEAEYRSARDESHPATLSDFLAGQPLDVKEKHMFEVYSTVVDNSKIGEEINNMRWTVLAMPPDAPPLLTSDRPIIRTSDIRSQNAHIAMPIGPKRLFLATPHRHVFDGIQRSSKKQVAREANRTVVRSAVAYVYSSNDAPLGFVQKHFGQTPQPRLAEQLLNKAIGDTGHS